MIEHDSEYFSKSNYPDGETGGDADVPVIKKVPSIANAYILAEKPFRPKSLRGYEPAT